MQVRPLGSTGLTVTPLCIGTAALGNLPDQYGYEVGEPQAVATMNRVFAGPANFVDTSNNYGDGDSERRIGKALAEVGGLPAGFVLATKVDPLPGQSDFSGRRVRESVAESIERLGVDRLQLIYLHDPERISLDEAMSADGAVRALVRLREEGIIGHLGVAGGPIDLMRRYLATGLFQAVISHNRFTLIDQSAEPLLADAVERDVAFINAAPYGGGILVKGPEAQPKYRYEPAARPIIDRVKAMHKACAGHEVPLAAAALQFSLREPRIASTIVGISRPERIDQTLRFAEWPVPAVLWEELAPLITIGRNGVD